MKALLALLPSLLLAAACSFDPAGPTPARDGGQRTDGAAGTIDAAGRPDAGPDAGPDAAVVGCNGSGDCTIPPGLCSLPGTCDMSSHTCQFPAVDCSTFDDECHQGQCDPGTGECRAQDGHEGEACGAGLMDCGDFGACGGFDDPICDETGTHSRTCTDHTCQSGACIATTYTDSEECTRVTEGQFCKSTNCTDFVCGGFTSVCDQTGTKTRTCTEYRCTSGLCASSEVMQSESCSRDTDGTTCADPTCSPPSPCGGFSGVCDESGTQSRSCTPFRCGGGACNPGAPFIESLDCTRSTDGQFCDVVCTGSGGGSCVDYCCKDGACPTGVGGSVCPSP